MAGDHRGLLKNGVGQGHMFYDKNTSQYGRFPDCLTAKSASEAFESARLVFLCVKPQGFGEPLSEIRNSGTGTEGKTLVSIVTGISIAKLCGTLGAEIPVVRVMPNTPMLIGEGVSALARNALVGDDGFTEILGLFGLLGRAVEMDESKMVDIIAETGSSPAYVYLFIKAMTDAAVKYGFDADEIKGLICDAVIGSAKLCKVSDKSPDELIKMVCSPGGTTLAAMDVFYKNNFEKIVADAMDACTKRAYELSAGK